MVDLQTQALLVQAKSDFLVFGSTSLRGEGSNDYKVTDTFKAAETAIRTGERQALGSSRVREAVFGHAVSAQAALTLSRYLHRPSCQAGERRTLVFDALSFVPAIHAALEYKRKTALDLLGIRYWFGYREVGEMFGVLGVQTFLFAPLPPDGGGADLVTRLKALPNSHIADGVGAGSLRTWYREASPKITSR